MRSLEFATTHRNIVAVPGTAPSPVERVHVTIETPAPAAMNGAHSLVVLCLFMTPAQALGAQLPGDTGVAGPDSTVGPPGSRAEPRDSTATRLFVAEDAVLRFGVGRATYDAEAQFPESRGRAILHAGLSAPLAAAPFLWVALDYWGGSRSFATDGGGSFVSSVDDESTLSLHVFTLGPLLVLPTTGPVRGYLFGSMALAYHKIRTDGTVVGFPTSHETDEDFSLTPIAGAGVRFDLGRVTLDVDYRAVDTRAAFRDYGITGARTGGSFVVFSLGVRNPGSRDAEPPDQASGRIE